MTVIEVVHESRAKDLLDGEFASNEIWIYGFGSLVHTQNFEFSKKVHGYIKGWRRVWWQGSTDHRGTPEQPGRTVTLTADPTAITWGAAFCLAGTREEQLKVLSYLEWREKQYDLRERVDVYAHDSHSEPVVRGALCYIATPCSVNNPNYLGPAPLEEIALQIAMCRGPSGPNHEYLFKLADAMREIAAHDEELFLLEKQVKAKMLELEGKTDADDEEESEDQDGGGEA